MKYLFGVVAGGLHLSVCEFHQDFRSPRAVGSGQVRTLRPSLCGSEVRNGFLVAAASLCGVARRDPIGEGHTEIPGLLEVISEQFWLRRSDETIIKLLQCS